MDHVGKLIKELRLRRGLTLRELGDKIGKTAAYISIIENKRPKLKRKLLGDFAEALDVDISFFIGDEEDILKKKSILRDLQAIVDRHTDSGEILARPHKIPVLSNIAAGEPMSTEDPFPVGVADEYIEVPGDITDPHAFALKIKGDSMQPRLYEGDIIVVCPSWAVREDKPVAVKLREDEVTCKIYSTKKEQIILKSLNPEYKPQVYDKFDIVWVYPVVRSIANMY